MQTIALENRAQLAQAEYQALAAQVANHTTLEAVVRWGIEQQMPRLIAGVVAQDEYTNDVLVRYRDDAYLVYDATWLGAVTAVAVWNHRPSERELLDARLARGWQPTPTATQQGARVLGYAACIAPARPHAA